jgi:hypothetical protein
MAEEINLVFVAKGINPRDIIEGAQNLFGRHGIPQDGFKLDDESRELGLKEVAGKLKKREPGPFEVQGQDFTLDVSRINSTRLWKSCIKTEHPMIIPWDEWVIELFNESFISAWVTDSDYQFWQNAEELVHYRALGRPWRHLPLKSNGLPPPLEQKVVDISNNAGRSISHIEFIEAVGAIMWFGERFWQVANADKQMILSQAWLKSREILPGVLRVQAAEQCFSSDQGEAGDLQRRLRALLFRT